MMQTNPGTWEAIEEEVLLEETTGEISELIVYNDDVNTFDWVIESLMDICKHSFEQAEQLSLIVHFAQPSMSRSVSPDGAEPGPHTPRKSSNWA